MALLQKRIARRYAKALFNALKKEQIASVLKELAVLAGVWDESEAFQNILDNPTFTYQQKSECLDIALKVAEISVSEVSNLAKLLLLNQRMEYMGMIEAEFRSLVDSIQKALKVELFSAVEMSEAEKASLNAKVSEVTKGFGSTYFHIDPELIGGLRIQVGDSEVDATISSALVELEQSLIS